MDELEYLRKKREQLYWYTVNNSKPREPVCIEEQTITESAPEPAIEELPVVIAADSVQPMAKPKRYQEYTIENKLYQIRWRSNSDALKAAGFPPLGTR